MTSKLYAALIAGAAALALATGTLAARAATRDAATDLDSMASTSGSAASDTAANRLEDRDAAEIIDVLMAAINAATEE